MTPRDPADERYARERLQPLPGDLLYLHLSDLLLALETVATVEPVAVLDYGADRAPYRALFPGARYDRADIEGESEVEYRIRPDGTVPAESGAYDRVISTQVAEHVEDPRVYFAECFRLLRPGGRLFLTTHGAFEDHGFPHDFQRWTGEGLRRDLQAAGFEQIEIHKLTAGPRALVFLAERCLETTFMRRSTPAGALLALKRGLVRRFRPALHRLSDRWFAEYRMLPADSGYYPIYVGLAAQATRPKDSSQ